MPSLFFLSSPLPPSALRGGGSSSTPSLPDDTPAGTTPAPSAVSPHDSTLPLHHNKHKVLWGLIHQTSREGSAEALAPAAREQGGRGMLCTAARCEGGDDGEVNGLSGSIEQVGRYNGGSEHGMLRESGRASSSLSPFSLPLSVFHSPASSLSLLSQVHLTDEDDELHKEP